MAKEEIRKLLRDDALVLGTDLVLKGVKAGAIKKVFVVSNVAARTLKMLQHYQKIANFELEQTELTNKELGILCRKRFSVAVIGVKA